LECKEALQASDGDMAKAVEALRAKGFAQAAKRADRATTQGVIESYIHTGGRVGALVELGCETDFVARTSEFQALAHDIAMQIAAMSPAYVEARDIEEGDERPPAQVSLMQQPFIKDNSRLVGEVIQEVAAKVGENVRIIRFTRLALGE
jgi:elongation factor Ts